PEPVSPASDFAPGCSARRTRRARLGQDGGPPFGIGSAFPTLPPLSSAVLARTFLWSAPRGHGAGAVRYAPHPLVASVSSTCARKPKFPARFGPTHECRKLRCKLLFPNKLRITGDFGPLPASRAAPVEGPKNARPWWGRAIRSVAFRDGRLCRKT